MKKILLKFGIVMQNDALYFLPAPNACPYNSCCGCCEKAHQ